MNNHGAVTTTVAPVDSLLEISSRIDQDQRCVLSYGTTPASTGYAGAIGVKASDIVTSIITGHLRPDQQRAGPTAAEENGDESTHADQHIVFNQPPPIEIEIFEGGGSEGIGEVAPSRYGKFNFRWFGLGSWLGRGASVAGRSQYY